MIIIFETTDGEVRFRHFTPGKATWFEGLVGIIDTAETADEALDKKEKYLKAKQDEINKVATSVLIAELEKFKNTEIITILCNCDTIDFYLKRDEPVVTLFRKKYYKSVIYKEIENFKFINDME